MVLQFASTFDMFFSRYISARKHHKTLSCNFFGVHVPLVHSLSLLISQIADGWLAPFTVVASGTFREYMLETSFQKRLNIMITHGFCHGVCSSLLFAALTLFQSIFKQQPGPSHIIAVTIVFISYNSLQSDLHIDKVGKH